MPFDPATVALDFLRRATLHAGKSIFRPVEVEVYYTSPDHPDPFTHRTALQKLPKRWYFHRQGASYRGGSFKGLDMTLGDGNGEGGLLLRGITTAEGTRIDGPCKLVEHLLQAAGYLSVAEFDAAIGTREVDDTDSPLHLRWQEKARDLEILATARVGLTLKRATADSAHRDFIGRRYRWIVDPARCTKGRDRIRAALLEEKN